LRTPRLALGASTLALVAALSSSPAAAASGSSIIGFGVGALLPEAAFAEFNDPSYFIQSRSLYVDKVVGGRAAAYYGDTAGSNGADGGRVYGFDFDFLLKFGSATTFAYVYAGAGYGTLTYTAAGPTPGSTVRRGGYDWCWTGGIGVTIKRKFYIEASYVSYQTGPETTDFIPVVIGYQF